MKIQTIYFLFIGMYASAQSEVRTVIHNGEGFQVQYDIKIDNGDTVKHGPYKRYEGSRLKELGTYLEGTKNHMWTYYYENGKKKAEGLYASNKEVGLWTYWAPSGELVQKYHHTLDSVYFFIDPNPLEKHYVVHDSGDTSVVDLDSPPLYLGGIHLAHNEAVKWLNYPLLARKAGIEGVAYIALWIDEEGSVTNYEIHKDPGEGCGEAALNAVQKIEPNWIPGKLNGKNVKAKILMSFHFKLG
jgi:TonB family protein